MNRGHDGLPIFRTGADKRVFLELLEKNMILTKIRVLAYCIMDTHYHLVIQNGSGQMPRFFKQLNGQYALHYRKVHGGRGYVFQNRYQTMLIQDDAYLMLAIAYVLNNPVKVQLASLFSDYPWSSGSEYFRGKASEIVDAEFVEGLFGSGKELAAFVRSRVQLELPTIRSEMGRVIGDQGFIPQARRLTDRRSGRESMERRRMRDKYFDPQEKVLSEFEQINRRKVSEIDVHSFTGKRLRSELLVLLKEKAGLTYREISKVDLFADLEFSSLGGIYRRGRRRMPTG